MSVTAMIPTLFYGQVKVFTSKRKLVFRCQSFILMSECRVARKSAKGHKRVLRSQGADSDRSLPEFDDDYVPVWDESGGTSTTKEKVLHVATKINFLCVNESSACFGY